MDDRPTAPIRLLRGTRPPSPRSYLERLKEQLSIFGGTRARAATGAPAGFCAAPWVEAVIRIDGHVLPCCRNEYRYGSIQDAPLASIWHSAETRAFRASIAGGVFPNPACEHCYRKGKATTLSAAFESLLGQLWERYAAECTAGRTAPDPLLCRLVSTFHAEIAANAQTLRTRRICQQLRKHAARVARPHRRPRARVALAKIGVIAQACLDYLTRTPEPRVVATIRQANLVAVCNARCVHCIGLYTEEIVRGEDIGGRRLKRMPEAQAARALERADDMTSFFMNGSEFLLHPQWRPMVSTLAESGVRLSMATNGMLLDPAATDFLLDSGVLFDVNFSFDGAREATVERIRAKVKYGKLVEHLRYFLAQQACTTPRVPICISMVLMRSNVDECGELVRLIDSIRAATDARIHVSFELLEHSRNEAYMRFFEREWIDIGDATARARLQEAAMLGEALGLRTLYSGEALSHALAGTVAPAATATAG
jgi:radical SAM protein with 4Fe4S-binding SPASM domain